MGVWLGEHPKKLVLIRISATVEASNVNLVHKFGLGLAYQKTTFWTKIGGMWAREHPKKFGTPYIFLQPLKLATSNLVHNLDLRLAYQKSDVWDQNWRGSGPKEHPKKNLGPLCIFATVEISNFKFGTQIGFGTSLPKRTFRTKISGGMGWGAHKKLGPPTYFCTVEATNLKFGTQIWFGTSLPKNDV